MPSLLNGIDHIYLSVTDYERSEAFYDRVMEALGLHKGDKAIGGEPHAHYVAPTFQLTIRPARSDAAHDAYAAGLHHLCFQARTNADVDTCHRLLKGLGIDATEPRLYTEYNPEYYATFFEDPDGLRLEINSRTSYRQALVDRWDEFDTFLNPLQTLRRGRMTEAPDSSTRGRLSLVVSALLAAVAVWRSAVGVGHYRSSLAITNDPSMRELEQVSAGFEFGFAALLAIHAVGIAVVARRTVRIDTAAMAVVAALTAVLVGAAMLRLPVLATPGLLGLALLGAGARYGYRDPATWLSVYVGAFVGATLGFIATVPGIDPIVGLAVVIPPALTALVGVGLGRLLGRKRQVG